MTLNRRGQIGEHALIFVFVAVAFIIAAGLFIGSLVFYGDGTDIRRAESSILANKVGVCLSEKGAGILNVQEEFLKVCGLNEEHFGGNYLGVKICEISVKECESSSADKLIQIGSNFEACFLDSGNTAYPICSYGKAVTSDGKRYTIIASSNQRTTKEKSI